MKKQIFTANQLRSVYGKTTPETTVDTKTQQEGEEANKFLGKSTLEQLTSKETLREIPGELAKTAKGIFVDTPVKIAKSLAGVPLSFATGGEKTIPGTYQAEAKQTASDIIEGKKPLASALAPFAEVPLDVISTVAGAKGAYEVGKKLITKAPEILGKGKELISTGKKMFEDKGSIKNAAKTIEAISSEPQGKAGVKAYQEIATKGREVTKRGLLTSQKLGPSEIETLRGSRLAEGGLKLGTSNTDNLKKIGKDLSTTETKLTTILKGEPDMVYNLDKSTLADKIEKIKTDSTGDFVGDAQKVYNNVMNFGKKILAKTDDTIMGGREGRKALDAGLRAKFPSAFKNGTIDPSTPAGSAIKKIRDTWNNHLYDTAPNGSEIQNLILRESDLLTASESVAKKALEQEGVKTVGELIKKYPVLKGLGLGLATGSIATGIYGFK